MNKLLVIPLAIMLMLQIFTMLYSPITLPGTQEFDPDMQYRDENGNLVYMEVSGVGGQTIDMATMVGLIALLIAGIAAGIAAGFSILGSGLSTFSQQLIINAIVYIGIWTFLSVLAVVQGVMNTTLGAVLFIVLTVMFVIGFVQESSGSVTA